MSSTPIIIQTITNFWILILLFVFATILLSPWFKGKIGEFGVNTSSKILLDKKVYYLIKNVTLPTLDGTTQIDHILVSIYGVFVVETKNLKGWIFGSPNQRTWTQKIYHNTYKFQNPLRQNYKHVKTLEHLFKLKDNQVHSVVVFVGDSTFKTEMPENVTYGGGYARYIKSKKQPVLTPAEVSDIIARIENGRISQSFNTHREHVRHVNFLKDKREGRVTCPKCRSPMVKRKSKKGIEFWGCSRFPQCRGTANIK